MDTKSIIIISITAIILFGITVFGIVGYMAFKKTDKGAAKSFSLLSQRGNFLKIATVIFVVIATIFLALVDIIKENGVIAILSGVVGYVLGGLEKGSIQRKEDG